MLGSPAPATALGLTNTLKLTLALFVHSDTAGGSLPCTRDIKDSSRRSNGEWPPLRGVAQAAWGSGQRRTSPRMSARAPLIIAPSSSEMGTNSPRKPRILPQTPFLMQCYCVLTSATGYCTLY